MKKQTSKEQLKLKLKAKEAETKARAVAAKSVHKPTPARDLSKTVSFDQWWMTVSKNPKVQPYLKEIFWADFKSRGCSKNETSQKYYELLDKFGYKL